MLTVHSFKCNFKVQLYFTVYFERTAHIPCFDSENFNPNFSSSLSNSIPSVQLKYSLCFIQSGQSVSYSWGVITRNAGMRNRTNHQKSDLRSQPCPIPKLIQFNVCISLKIDSIQYWIQNHFMKIQYKRLFNLDILLCFNSIYYSIQNNSCDSIQQVIQFKMKNGNFHIRYGI